MKRNIVNYALKGKETVSHKRRYGLNFEEIRALLRYARRDDAGNAAFNAVSLAFFAGFEAGTRASRSPSV